MIALLPVLTIAASAQAPLSNWDNVKALAIGTQASGLRAAEPGRKGLGQAVPEQADRIGPCPVDAADRGLHCERIGDGGAVSAAQGSMLAVGE